MNPCKAVLGIGHGQTDDRQTEMLDIEPLQVEPTWLVTDSGVLLVEPCILGYYLTGNILELM